MAGAVLAKFGQVDVLVNCAGIFTERRVENMPIEDWDRVLNVNLRGTFLCTRFLLNQMLERGWGRIINIASQLGQIGGVEAAHYSASKAGVIGFTKSLAREVGARGVLVNAIAPRSDRNADVGGRDRAVALEETPRATDWPLRHRERSNADGSVARLRRRFVLFGVRRWDRTVGT